MEVDALSRVETENKHSSFSNFNNMRLVLFCLINLMQEVQCWGTARLVKTIHRV